MVCLRTSSKKKTGKRMITRTTTLVNNRKPRLRNGVDLYDVFLGYAINALVFQPHEFLEFEKSCNQGMPTETKLFFFCFFFFSFFSTCESLCLLHSLIVNICHSLAYLN